MTAERQPLPVPAPKITTTNAAFWEATA
ncbi:MAG: hypothetical protein RL487_1124, partial [Actinomycetota bacterium]